MTGVVSLALLFALTTIVLLTEWTRADVMLFVRDSVKMAEKAAPVDLRTSDTEEAEQSLKRHLGFAPMLRRRRATTAQAKWGVIVLNPLLDIEHAHLPFP